MKGITKEKKIVIASLIVAVLMLTVAFASSAVAVILTDLTSFFKKISKFLYKDL